VQMQIAFERHTRLQRLKDVLHSTNTGLHIVSEKGHKYVTNPICFCDLRYACRTI
jgi:hypothetical protein